jgi:hypothetical protein
VGYYVQNAFNFHAYQEFFIKVMDRSPNPEQEHSLRHNMASPPSARWNPYTDLASGGMHVIHLFAGDHQAYYADWLGQLNIFLDGASSEDDGLRDSFFLQLAVPIRESHAAYRAKKYGLARNILEGIPARNDWKLACQQWLSRRFKERHGGNAGATGDAA